MKLAFFKRLHNHQTRETGRGRGFGLKGKVCGLSVAWVTRACVDLFCPGQGATPLIAALQAVGDCVSLTVWSSISHIDTGISPLSA